MKYALQFVAQTAKRRLYPDSFSNVVQVAFIAPEEFVRDSVRGFGCLPGGLKVFACAHFCSVPPQTNSLLYKVFAEILRASFAGRGAAW